MEGTIVLTGANGTLALEFVRHVLKRYPKFALVLTVRDTSSSDPHTAKLRSLLTCASKKHEAKTEIIKLDLGSLSQVRNFTDNLSTRVRTSELPPLRAVICNAFFWTLSGPVMYSENEYELGFQVTHLAHFLLVLKLLGPDVIDTSRGKIVFLGSSGHAAASLPQNLQKLVKPDADTPGQEMGCGISRYFLAKLCNILFLHDLNARLSKDSKLSNITALAMDPGNMPASRAFSKGPTKFTLQMNYLWAFWCHISKYWDSTRRPPMDAAKDLAELALGTPGEGKRGYYVGLKETKSSEKSYDEADWRRLWFACAEWVSLRKDETFLDSSS